MKKIFYIIIATLFMYNCDRDCEHLGNYIFTEEQLQYVPYELNENVTFTTSAGDTLTGIVTKKNVKRENYKINGTCDYLISEYIYSSITFDESNTINVSLSNNPKFDTTLVVGVKKNNVWFADFQPYTNNIEELTFETIVLKDYIFENSLLLIFFYENNIIGQIVYSKTNGIEFILFEDGSWYKRLEE